MLQRLHQLTKTFLADGVFHAAGIFFGGVRGNARLDQPPGKKAVLRVDLLRRFQAGLGQVQIAVRVPGEEPALSQKPQSMADTCFGVAQVLGNVNGPHLLHTLASEPV